MTRFAPSPTGLLHVGHAYSAVFAFEAARSCGGRFVLRIEDIDHTRCRRSFEEAILEDLEWLGLTWEHPVRRQSDHLTDYAKVAGDLKQRGLLYPCFCTRKDILREIQSAGGAPQGAEGPLYPGTCRHLSVTESQDRMDAGESFALRLNLERALREAGSNLQWLDRKKGIQRAQPELFGDVVLVRKDIGCSYHLAVVCDDALQEITLVTRGMDLFAASHLHRLLQALLNLPTPEYHHHDLVCDSTGQRLAKRDGAESLRSLRQTGLTPADIRIRLGL